MNNIAQIVLHPFFTRRSKTKSMAIGWLALTVMILAGSTFTSFGKQLTTVFSPLSMIFVSEGLMFVFAIISFGLIPSLKKLLTLKSKYILPLICIGIINGIASPFLWFFGLQYTNAVNAEIFGKSEMLFLILLSGIFLHQKFRSEHLIGGCIILLGLLVVTMKGFSDGFNFQLGDTIILFASLLYASGGLTVGMKLRHMDPEVLIMVRSLCAIAFFFALSPFIEHPFISEAREFPFELIPALVGFGLIARFLTMFAFYEAIERVPISTFSTMATLTTAGSAFFAYIYLGELLHWYQLAGAVLIILGAVFVHLNGLHRQEKHMKHQLKSHHRHHI